MLKQNDAVRKLLNVDTWHKAGYTGKGVAIVVLDSNKGKPLKGMDTYYTDVFGNATESGHATNVSQVIHEFAPDAKILYFDYTRNKDAVFEWIKTRKDEIDLINVSLAGILGMETPDYLRFRDLDIPMFCASGNDGYDDHISYPANYDFTIAIGSTSRAGDDVDSYSNGGPKLNAVCPSHIPILNGDGEVWEPSGTSYADPVAVGITGPYIEYRKAQGLPKLTQAEAVEFVDKNCKDIEGKGFDYASGYGLFCLPETIPNVVAEPIKEKEIPIMKKIYISPSSQEQNKGLSPFSTEEKEMNGIADNLIPLLVKDGRFVVKRNTPSMDVYSIANDSNEFKADIHVAIHSNAGGAEGTEVYAYAPNTNSERLAKALYNQIAPLSPGSDRGVKYNPKLIEVGDMVNATSALIELAFHDNAKDATWIAYNHEMIAKRLYMGICDYLGYSYEALVVTPVVAPPVTPAVDKNAQVIALLNQVIAILKG